MRVVVRFGAPVSDPARFEPEQHAGAETGAPSEKETDTIPGRDQQFARARPLEHADQTRCGLYRSELVAAVKQVKNLFASILFASLIAVRAQETASPFEHLGTPLKAPPRTFDLLPSGGDQITFTNFLRITNRETSRQFYNLVFGASEGVSMDWSGTYAGAGAQGTNSSEYLEAVARRVNYFRAMAGVPAWITLNNEYSRKAQAAALMMGGNNQINHYPPPTWRFYSADGAEAAQNSNLSLGNAGPQAVMSQLRDNGANNAIAGHRRWILYPQIQMMGSGNVPATGTNLAVTDLWVFDTHIWDARPATRESFVAWPPPGYVPHSVVYARWSFAYPNADLTGTTVSMTSNGAPITVFQEAVLNGYGENTLVWIPDNWDELNLANFPKPATNTTYHVTLNNVLINGTPQTFAYDVFVFDPTVPGPDYIPALITGPTNPAVNVSTTYAFTAASNASSYEFRRSSLTNGTFIDGAENGLVNFTVNAATNLYNVRDNLVKFGGTYSFHLTHTQAVSQTLTLNRLFLATGNSAVQFRSELGYATANQIARVQMSLDEGSSWNDIYTQPGSGGSGEGSFTLRTASMAAYAGRTFRLRLNYDFQPGSYYYQASTGVGWYVDNFTVTNAPEVMSSTIAAANTNRTFGFSPTNAGSYLLEVRPLLFGDYPSEWGPSFAVAAMPNTNVVVRITDIIRAGGNTWHVNFQLLNGNPAGYELWSATNMPAVFTKESTATIQTIVAGSQYRAVITTPTTNKFFRIKPF